MKKHLVVLFWLLILFSSSMAEEWFQFYQQGLEAIQEKNYTQAIEKFEAALQQESTDKQKVRTYGMHFISYYPNREIGIAHFYLGNISDARRYLQISLSQAPTSRAREYLNQTSQNAGPIQTIEKKAAPVKVKPSTEKVVKIVVPKTKVSGKIKRVGERMSVAVLPFENKGASRDLGDIVFDKMITALFNEDRFKVIERSQLESVLEEQKLGASGILDASSAAELGRGLGVDAIILGSVAAAPNGAISLDARAIDTETAMIIVAHDAYSAHSDAQSVKNTVAYLAKKFVSSLPLIQGTVIRLDAGNIMLDVGRNGGLKKGIKCTIYREGNEIKHPVTGEILGTETTIVGEMQITDPFDRYASGRIIRTNTGQTIQVGDKFITK